MTVPDLCPKRSQASPASCKSPPHRLGPLPFSQKMDDYLSAGFFLSLFIGKLNFIHVILIFHDGDRGRGFYGILYEIQKKSKTTEEGKAAEAHRASLCAWVGAVLERDRTVTFACRANVVRYLYVKAWWGLDDTALCLFLARAVFSFSDLPSTQI
jgi:hypothetical protein